MEKDEEIERKGKYCQRNMKKKRGLNGMQGMKKSEGRRKKKREEEVSRRKMRKHKEREMLPTK